MSPTTRSALAAARPRRPGPRRDRAARARFDADLGPRGLRRVAAGRLGAARLGRARRSRPPRARRHRAAGASSSRACGLQLARSPRVYGATAFDGEPLEASFVAVHARVRRPPRGRAALGRTPAARRERPGRRARAARASRSSAPWRCSWAATRSTTSSSCRPTRRGWSSAAASPLSAAPRRARAGPARAPPWATWWTATRRAPRASADRDHRRTRAGGIGGVPLAGHGGHGEPTRH